MAKEKKNTVKRELEQLDREALRDMAAAPVAGTNVTGVQGVLGGVSPAYQAAYAAERARLDAAVANGPLFAGQTGPGTVLPDAYTGDVGGDIARQVMQQGLYPQTPVPAQATEVQAQPQVAAQPTGVGSKVAEQIYRQGVNPDQYAGQVGGNLARQVMEQGVNPPAPAKKTGEKEQAVQRRQGNWNDFLDPYIARQKEMEAEMAQVQELDAEMQRKEDARKRIVALGDAFASFANLVGTAHGAENQKQTYASPLVAESVEGSRKLRAGRMQQIRKNIDEQRAMILELQMKNDPNLLTNRLAQQRLDLQYGNQQLQYDKLANTAANQAATQELNRDKFTFQQEKDARDFGYKQETDARKFDLDERKFKDSSARGWANNRVSQERLAYQKERDAAKGAGGSGGGGWSNDAYANFNAFKTEIAQKAGYATWEEFASDPSARANNSVLVREVNEASTSPNKQKGVLSSYAEQYAPQFFEKYFVKGQTPTSPTSNGKKANPMGPAPKKKKANPMN